MKDETRRGRFGCAGPATAGKPPATPFGTAYFAARYGFEMATFTS